MVSVRVKGMSLVSLCYPLASDLLTNVYVCDEANIYACTLVYVFVYLNEVDLRSQETRPGIYSVAQLKGKVVLFFGYYGIEMK